MRNLFLIVLIVIILLAFANISYLPQKQFRAKEIVDNHINSLLISDANEITYVGHVTLIPFQVYVEDLNITAGYAKWDRIQYNDIVLKVDRINYDPSAVYWRNIREIESIEGITFEGHIGYEEIALRIANSNTDLVDPVLRYDGGHLFLRAYYVPLKSKLEFDGKMILTPTGDLKYSFNKITNVDQEVIDSRKVRNMIEDTTDLSVSIRIMQQRIALDELESDENGVIIKGRSSDTELEESNS